MAVVSGSSAPESVDEISMLGAIIPFQFPEPFVNPPCFTSVKQIEEEPDEHENSA